MGLGDDPVTEEYFHGRFGTPAQASGGEPARCSYCGYSHGQHGPDCIEAGGEPAAAVCDQCKSENYPFHYCPHYRPATPKVEHPLDRGHEPDCTGGHSCNCVPNTTQAAAGAVDGHLEAVRLLLRERTLGCTDALCMCNLCVAMRHVKSIEAAFTAERQARVAAEQRVKELDPDPVVCNCRSAGECTHGTLPQMPRQVLVDHFRARAKADNDYIENLQAQLTAAQGATTPLAEAIQQALCIATAAPELNMDDYDQEQVEELNEAMIAVFTLLQLAQSNYKAALEASRG